MKIVAALAVLFVATTYAIQLEAGAAMEAYESESMAVMAKLGLRDVQELVDKDLWEARQAQASADAEDEEIARLLAQLSGLDDEKEAALREAKQREIATKEATAAKLKEISKEKFELAKNAIDAKARRVEEVALEAQKQAESNIDKTKRLQAEAAAAMSAAKVAASEYQNALTAGLTEKTQELQIAAEKAMAHAKQLAEEAGSASASARSSLQRAAEVKGQADKAVRLEKESRGSLMQEGLQWVAGPIFDKMKKLCERDYPTFRKEYSKISQSPSYKAYRWDIKQACKKARADDLETDLDAGRMATEQAKALENVHSPDPDKSKPYPKSHTYYSVPEGGKVKKWCTTQYGAVPCTMLKKAKEAGLLGDIRFDAPTKKAVALLELGQVSPL